MDETKSKKSESNPDTKALINRNSLALGTVSQQLANISQQIGSLNQSLRSVYVNISSNTNLQRQKDLEEQNRERILAEQKLREGKESLIERKIQNALISPVQKVSQSASITLNRLMGVFGTLLGGWLLNQGLSAFNELKNDNKEKLNEIKNSVIGTLGVVGGVYASIRFGLVGVVNALTRSSSKIASAIATGLFLRPATLFIDGLKNASSKVLPKIKNQLKNLFPFLRSPAPTTSPKPQASTPAPTTSPKPQASTPAPTTSPKPQAPTTSPKPQALSKTIPQTLPFFKKSLPLGGAISGGIGAGVDIMQGEDPGKAVASNVSSSYLAGGIGNLASKFIPGPPIVKLSAGLIGFLTSYGPILEASKNIYDKAIEMFNSIKDQNFDYSSIFSQPSKDIGISENIIDSESKPNLTSMSNKDDSTITNISIEEPDFSQPPLYGSINLASLLGEEKTSFGFNDFENIKDTSIKNSEFNFSVNSMYKNVSMEDFSPLPDAQPIFVPLPTENKPKTKNNLLKGSDGKAGHIPSISSSNEDNFYILYSQVHYNVVV